MNEAPVGECDVSDIFGDFWGAVKCRLLCVGRQ